MSESQNHANTYDGIDDDNFSEPNEFYENVENLSSQNRVIDTSNGKTDGLDKCPTCGSSEIQYNHTSHSLQCMFCRAEWNEKNAEQTFGFDSAIKNLKGSTTGSGSGDIKTDATMVTIKCQGCGAEIVVNIDETMQSKCHWCRQVLSINTQIPNGAVPDAVLPFTINHETAVSKIDEFVSKRKIFAWKKFKQEFQSQNVVGVFMPYMVIDGNLTGKVVGTGEIETRRYTVTVGTGDNKRSETRYDADVYRVERDFDFEVDDLITESSSERANMDIKKNTNNVLNAVLPFDTKNALTYNSNYLKGFTSEKRDLDVLEIDDRVIDQFKSIARAKASDSAEQYGRGIKWEAESLQVHGTRWVAVYLPVWLYSYYVDKGNGESFVHYIAVNGRTGKTMGSVPVSHIKLFIASSAAAIASLGAAIPMFLGGL